MIACAIIVLPGLNSQWRPWDPYNIVNLQLKTNKKFLKTRFFIDSDDLKEKTKNPSPEEHGINCTDDENKNTCIIVFSVFGLAFLVVILVGVYIFYQWRMAKKRKLKGQYSGISIQERSQLEN